MQKLLLFIDTKNYESITKIYNQTSERNLMQDAHFF